MIFDVKGLLDISDKLGVIDALKAKLFRQPDPAAAKLEAVLAEVSKTYLALEQELVRYLSLTLDPRELAEERPVLIELEGGQMQARMGQARGHCHKISNIYARYLSPWFQALLARSDLTSQNVSELDHLFKDLGNTDTGILDIVDHVSGWLVQEASEVSELLDKGDVAAAQARLAKARKEVLPARQALAQAMRKIYDIEAALVTASGAV